MKNKKIFALMAAALSLAACSTNDVADITHDDADNVVNVASVTRSPEGGTASSTSSPMSAPFHLVNKTQQTVYRANYEADFQATLNEDGSVSGYTISNGKILWCNKMSDGVRMDNVFEAFSPLKTAENNASFTTFNIPTDQSTATLLQSADWMTATTTKKKAEATNGLELIFSHRNAKLHFDVTFKGDVETSNVTLSSDNFKVVDFITPCYTATGNSKTIEAIVEADKDYSGVNLIEVTINFDANNSETYKVSLPSGLTQFEEGKQYNFTLTIGHNQATISSVYVTDWEDGNIELNGNDDALLDGYTVSVDPETGVRTFTVSNYAAYKAWTQTNDVENTNITLDGDITVPDGETLPYISSFNGVFDGKGHTIKNIKNLVEYKHCILGSTNYGTIKNVNFDIDITTEIFSGIVVSNNEGTIENCTISGSAITLQGDYRRFSGICAHNQDGIIIACVNNISVTQPVGDINGTITSGGICEQNGGLIIGCINNGNISLVSADNSQYCVIAGIAANNKYSYYSTYYGTIIACANTGTISSNNPIFHNSDPQSKTDYCYWTQGNESTTDMTNSGKVTSWDDMTISKLNSAKDGDDVDAKTIKEYGYEFKTDDNGKLIIVPYTPSSSSAARR